MNQQARRSIAKTASVSGTGIHTGARVTLTFRPGDPGQGVVFRRTDLEGRPEVPAKVEYLEAADRRTVLAKGDARISTVEHVLAAVYALQIDDVTIELDGPEPPILDGSAEPYYRALLSAEPKEVEGVPAYFRIGAPAAVREGDSYYLVAPGRGLRVTVTVEWPHPAIGRQSGCFDVTPDGFGVQLAGARTFGFAEELEELKSRGLALGAGPESGILLTASGVANTELRWPDEFARHKAVDLLGDLCLLGGRLEAEIVAFKPSHRGNAALIKAIKRAASPNVPVMGIEQILGVIPHRQPMLLVDRVVEIDQGKRIVGIKNVTINEPFFEGHFPGHPIMPGVLIIEAMAQVGGLLLLGQVDDPQNKVVYFMSIDNAKFRKPVVPGDQIRFELEMVQFRGKTCKMRGVGYVDGQVVAEADLMARVVDR
ncbi:UDP-3-O-acyl-N-acetylglucosamine deacetylase [bacterium HR33]|nr:UDP-3-O-acyl-N-acetylglucosamine deacetylase [bacterium HR33]